jgi:hypothetical protein
MRDPRLALFENSTPHGTQNDGVSMGVGLGKPHDDGNHLYNIRINDYQASDANFVGDGEEGATSQNNIPAILAARQAGGYADPKTIHNGINKRFSLNPGPSLQESNMEKVAGTGMHRFAKFVDHGAQAINNFRKGNLISAKQHKEKAGEALKKFASYGKHAGEYFKRKLNQGGNSAVAKMSPEGRQAGAELGQIAKSKFDKFKNSVNDFKKL